MDKENERNRTKCEYCGEPAWKDPPPLPCPHCWTRYAKANPKTLAGQLLAGMQMVRSPWGGPDEARFTNRQVCALLLTLTEVVRYRAPVLHGEN